ncbi:MAG: hypothetical protein H6581_11810 [Bacteroidia bacterium]|nr:hypothetical protein [Bacteroidia bacterium]
MEKRESFPLLLAFARDLRWLLLSGLVLLLTSCQPPAAPEELEPAQIDQILADYTAKVGPLVEVSLEGKYAPGQTFCCSKRSSKISSPAFTATKPLPSLTRYSIRPSFLPATRSPIWIW